MLWRASNEHPRLCALTYHRDMTSATAPEPTSANVDREPSVDIPNIPLLDEAIANMASTAPASVGPGEADLAYGGDAELWTKLAHTLKARIHLHTAEVRPDAYAQVLAEARAR